MLAGEGMPPLAKFAVLLILIFAKSAKFCKDLCFLQWTLQYGIAAYWLFFFLMNEITQ